MPDGLIAVFLYRDEWDDHSFVFGESRAVSQPCPSTVIGVATRKPHDTIGSKIQTFEEFRQTVEETADDIRWFDDPMECSVDGEADDDA